MKVTGIRAAAGLAIMLSVAAGQARALEPKYDFGKIPYGQKVAHEPSWAVKSTCGGHPDTMEDCDFFDGNGIRYVVSQGEVMRKHLDLAAFSGALPYGLTPTDTAPVAVRKLKAALNLVFSKTADKDGQSIYTSNAFDTKDYGGLVIVLTFDRAGKLAAIEITSDYT